MACEGSRRQFPKLTVEGPGLAWLSVPRGQAEALLALPFATVGSIGQKVLYCGG